MKKCRNKMKNGLSSADACVTMLRRGIVQIIEYISEIYILKKM